MPGFWRTLTVTAHGSGGTTSDHARHLDCVLNGCLPPFGYSAQLRLFIDPDLLQYDEVWAAAGTWNDVFGIEPHKLVEASGGAVTELKRA